MGEGEWREERITGKINCMIFFWKVKTAAVRREPVSLWPCVKTLLPWGNSVMWNSKCAYLGASPPVRAKTKQESSQPGCLFSENCRNLIPLETSVPLSDLPKIDQQIQRSLGSIEHEHINLISFGSWKKKQQSIFCTVPNKSVLILFS